MKLLSRKISLRKETMLYVFLTLLCVLLLFLIGLKEFKLWPQVELLWEAKFNLKYFLSHPHGTRYLLVYPIFFVSEYIGIGYNILFSWLVIFFIGPLIVYKNIKLSEHFGLQTVLSNVTLLLVFNILLYFMNGRIVFSLLGASIFVELSFSQNKGFYYLKAFLAIFLSTASSGTTMVLVAWFLLYEIFFRKKNAKDRVLFLLICGVGAYYLLDFFVLIISKNINFFGGGITGLLNMLSHGMGKILLIGVEVSILILFIILTAATIIWLSINILKMRLNIQATMFLFIAIVFGSFGYSTATMGVPIILLCVNYLIFKYSSNTRVGCD